MASPAKNARLAAQARGFTQVVARGRGSLYTFNPGTNKVAIDTQVGDIGWHLPDGTEVDTAWVDALPADSPYIKRMVLAEYNAYFGNGNLQFDPAYPFRYANPNTGDWIQWQPSPNLQWSNDLNSVANIGQTKQAVAAQLQGDDTYFFPGVYGAGFDFFLETQTARLQKRLRIDSLAALGAPTQAIIDGGNPVAVLSFQFLRSAGVTIWLDGVQWGEGNGQANARASVNHVEFRASDGTTLWYMSPAIAWDAVDNQLTGPIRFRRSGASYIIELRVPWSWLQTATYPVEIDPTIDTAIAGGTYDGYELASSVDNNETSVVMSVGHASNRYRCCFVFPNVTIPVGATITAGRPGFWFYNASVDSPDTVLYMQDAVNPAAIVEADGNIDGRPLTTASYTYQGTNLPTGQYSYTADDALAAAIQELVDAYDYSSGAPMAIIGFEPTGGTDANCRSYDSSSSQAATLHIEYTAGGGAANIDPAEATQAQTSDAATVKAIYALAPSEATQAQASDAAQVIAIYTVTPDEAAQAQTSDAASVTAISPIAPAEAVQAQTSDAATVTAIYLITPAEAVQSQTSDEATLTGAGVVNITPAEAVQAQVSDAAIVTAIYPLAPAEATQAQTSDAVSLTAYEPTYQITVADATQAQTSDAAILTAIYLLSAAEATQAQTSDLAVLTISGATSEHGARQPYVFDTRGDSVFATRANHTLATRSNLEVDD